MLSRSPWLVSAYWPQLDGPRYQRCPASLTPTFTPGLRSSDGAGIMGIFIGAATVPGTFELYVDDVRLK